MKCVLLLSDNPKSTQTNSNKALYLIFHSERNNLLPRPIPLTKYAWKWLDSISDFGAIYMPPKTKRKFHKESGQIYIIGGYDHRKKKIRRSIMRYDFNRCEWLQCGKLSIRRFGFTPFLYDGKIYCAGGYIGKHNLTNSVEFYEPVMNIVDEAEPLPQPAAQYAVAYNKSNVFIVGGIIQARNGMIKISNHFWSLVKKVVVVDDGDAEYATTNETLTHQWDIINSAKFPVSEGIIGHRAVLNDGGSRLYIVGGTSSDNKTDSQLTGLFYIDLINISSSSENETRSVWRKREINSLQVTNAAVVLIANKIFTIGGTKNQFDSTVSIAEINEEEVEKQLGEIQNDNQILNETNNTSTCRNLSFCPINEQVGYYDWRRKIYRDVFPLKHRHDMDLSKVFGVVIDMDKHYAEFKEDKLDWMLQWPIW